MDRDRLVQTFSAIVLLLLIAAPATAQDDGFTEASIAFNLRDISGSGTFVDLSDDEVSGAVAIGFTFNFYGVDYTSAYISSNGFITFSAGQSQGCCTGANIPDFSSPNNLIAGFWEDLNNPQGNIRYETLGTIPNREFVVGFYDNPHFFDGPQVNFEMILHEGSNEVEFQYADAPGDGGTHTVGTEDSNGVYAYVVARGNLNFQDAGFLLSPAPIVAERIPTLGGAALALLALLLGVIGVTHFRRQQVNA